MSSTPRTPPRLPTEPTVFLPSHFVFLTIGPVDHCTVEFPAVVAVPAVRPAFGAGFTLAGGTPFGEADFWSFLTWGTALVGSPAVPCSFLPLGTKQSSSDSSESSDSGLQGKSSIISLSCTVLVTHSMDSHSKSEQRRLVLFVHLGCPLHLYTVRRDPRAVPVVPRQ